MIVEAPQSHAALRGRGASWSPANRFEKLHVDLTDPDVVDAGFDQDLAGADGFGIFSDEGSGLRERLGAPEQRADKRQQSKPFELHEKTPSANGSQKIRRLSIRMVTGPSLTNSTCIWARKTPASTVRPNERKRAMTSR